jgi:chitinase
MEVDTETPLADDEIETVFPGTATPVGQAVTDDPDTEDTDGTDSGDTDGTDSGGDTDGTDSTGDTDGTDS